MKVINHKEFAFFEYESVPSTKYSLGDILFKYPDILSNEKPDIGVILQIQDELEFRTDSWGNSCDSDLITFATKEQIKKFRPELLNKIHMETNIDLEKDQHLFSIRKEGNLLGHIETKNGKLVTCGSLGDNVYDNFVELIKGLQGYCIHIDNFYW